MTKRRPGIFDPWRQAAATPEEAAAEARVIESNFEGDDAEPHCVQFFGQRAGVNVWLPRIPENPSQSARAVLIELVHRLYGVPEAIPILTSWEIFNEERKEPHAVILRDGGKLVTIVSPVDGETKNKRAMDSLALALREITNAHTLAAEIIAALRVKPFVK